jgi:hypothetical protein
MPAKSQNFPTKDSLEDDRAIDFSVFECLECSLIQLNSEPVLSYKDVIRATAYSPSMKEFRNVFFREFIKKFTLDGKKILEIGVDNGGSIFMWREYFPEANIIGIDNKDCPQLENRDRINFVVEDAYSYKALDQLPNDFDVIIDDGSHTLESMTFVIKEYLNELPTR